MRKRHYRGLLVVLTAAFSAPAGAFCVHNNTEQTVYFEVGDHGIQFTKKVGPESMACCDWRQENCNWTRTAWGKLSVRIYVRPPNGTPVDCSTRIRADGDLWLTRFEPAEQCTWELR